jgi:hypothetical protein
VRVPIRKAISVTLGAAALALAVDGCGTSDRDDVQAKVEQFVHATSKKDYKTLCSEVLAPKLVENLVARGLRCEQALQIGFGKVTNPTLSIGRITVNGQNASAITLTGASGQQSSLDAIELVKTSQGWRVVSLGSPVVPKGK